MNQSRLSPPAAAHAVAIRPADLAAAADAAAVLGLLDAYARDPMGQGRPLTREARACLIPALRRVSDALVLLAVVDPAAWGAADPPAPPAAHAPDAAPLAVPEAVLVATPVATMAGAGALAVGVAVCFTGFSTFQARGLLNLHDLALLPAWRGRGIGRRLLAAVEAIARARGYCKITLEVRGDNAPARALYASAGFGVAPPDAAVPMADGANSSTAITHLFCEKRLAD